MRSYNRFPQIIAELEAKADLATRAVAERIEQEAKQRVHVNSGDLRDEIHVDREESKKYYVVAGDTDVFYGHMEEFGTRHSSAHPFLVPALEANRDTALATFKAALRGL
jgi:HK97 gp10 family phage protein